MEILSPALSLAILEIIGSGRALVSRVFLSYWLLD